MALQELSASPSSLGRRFEERMVGDKPRKLHWDNIMKEGSHICFDKKFLVKQPAQAKSHQMFFKEGKIALAGVAHLVEVSSHT